MTDSEPPPGSPPGASTGLPRVAQMLIMIGAGIVLAVGGCALALNSGLNAGLVVYGVVFCVGVLAFIGGLIGLFLKKASPLKLIGFAVLTIIALSLAWSILAAMLNALS